MSDVGDARGGAVTRNPPRRELRPTGVAPETSWTGTLKRTWSEFREDDLTDWAAALTYYGLLSLFPALIAVSSLIGLFADPQTITDIILNFAPESAADTLSGPIDSITSNQGAAGLRADPRRRPRPVGRVRLRRRVRARRATSSTRRARGGRSGSCARSRSW